MFSQNELTFTRLELKATDGMTVGRMITLRFLGFQVKEFDFTDVFGFNFCAIWRFLIFSSNLQLNSDRLL